MIFFLKKLNCYSMQDFNAKSLMCVDEEEAQIKILRKAMSPQPIKPNKHIVFSRPYYCASLVELS